MRPFLFAGIDMRGSELASAIIALPFPAICLVFFSLLSCYIEKGVSVICITIR